MRLTETHLDCNFEILEDERGKPLRVGGEMQLSDRKNANGRIYSEALWRRVMESQKTLGRLKERRMVGELDHPASGKTSVERISHVMTNLELKESKRFPGVVAVYGVYECIPTPNGKILETLHRHKIGVAVSSRGDGDLEERGGESYVIPESYELDTFDAVMDPSVNVQVGVLECKGAALPKVPVKAVENLVRAIYGIVESGNFDREAAAYYITILENVHPDGSEAYLMATEALKELTEHLEVTKVMKTNGTAGLPESSTSGLNEQVQALMTENTELKKQLEGATKRADAGQRLCQELLITSRGLKMQAESAVAKLRELSPVAERYESAKQVIAKMRESILSLQNEGKLRIAAERLLGALLSKIDESKRIAYVDGTLLKNESVDVRKQLRPILIECESKSAANRLMRVFKSTLKENRNSRGLPPVTESGRRAARIPSESPLLENNNGDVAESQGTKAPTEKLQEQVDFTKRLLKAGRGQ